MGILPTNYNSVYEDPANIFQVGEAENSKDGVYYYSTFSQIGNKFFYIGILPDMNNLEKEPEIVEKYCDFCPDNF